LAARDQPASVASHLQQGQPVKDPP
jgi:hypothetical protein